MPASTQQTQSATAREVPEAAPRLPLRSWSAWLWRGVSYLVVAAIAGLFGWQAGEDLTEELTTVSRLEVAHTGVVVAPTGDLRAQMTVVNYGDISFRLSALRVGGDRQAFEPMAVPPSAARTVSTVITCKMVQGQPRMPQIAVEFTSDEGQVQEAGFLVPDVARGVCGALD